MKIHAVLTILLVGLFGCAGGNGVSSGAASGTCVQVPKLVVPVTHYGSSALLAETVVKAATKAMLKSGCSDIKSAFHVADLSYQVRCGVGGCDVFSRTNQ